MNTIIDTAAGFPPAAALKAAGHTGLMAYVSPSRSGTNFPGKPITRDIADAYRKAGIDIGAVWQLGKPGDQTPSDWTTGREGGRRMAREARDRAFAAGMPGYCPIYFAVDENITLAQWNSTAVEFFRGCGDVLGTQWVGIYGSSRVCGWAIEDGVIGRSSRSNSGPWAWVTRAWSDDNGRGYASLYQRVIDTPSSPGPKVGGITVDVNDVYAADWGQWSIDRTPKTTPSPDPTSPAPVIPTPAPTTGAPTMPDYGTTKVMHGFNADSAGTGNSNGPRRSTDFGAVHTQQGKGPAVNLAQFCINSANTSNPVAYNHSIDGRDTVEIVPPNEGPWAAADANDIAYHLCIAGSFAEWSRGQWLDGIDDSGDGLSEDLAITRAAKAMAAASQQFGFPLDYAGSNGTAGWPLRAKGVVGHRDFGARGGGHTDPGNGFPMDEFLKRAKSFLAPVRNLINDAAAASPWVGARVDPPFVEHALKAGVFAVYANAHIYYKQGAEAAFPIPHGGLFETWGADYGYENGRLGYPTRPFLKLPDGAVQAFEGGTLLRKDGASRGFDVHGRIGDTYRDLGWENSRLGYPVSEEIKVPGTDNIVQHFEHGDLTWSPSGVIVTLAKETAAA
ncbi:glycoside hydrolase domain-containing protein [Williamsia serinedens]|uniref:LGFP repeat-containing protein n=1 Tax=Williamsia serinedens TaxID=391736 RepID=A0ABT1H5Y0_9NOCA|nr:glycoside hydrolase domain-containing protein [Williamsia serinedens]MCP2162649.1 LGFP repeat-containing protein [Williamsia serinedens]